MESVVIDNTPWQTEMLGGRLVRVKREDLCCPPPGPGFSKMRGVEKYVRARQTDFIPPSRLGVVDSIHSKAGWGVAWLGQQLGLGVTVFYPYTKQEGPAVVRPFQTIAQGFGADIVGLPATKSSVLFYQARKSFYERYPEGLLLPNGLRLEDTIEQTAREVVRSTPRVFVGGTWVVSVSSGTIAAGVARGLRCLGFSGVLILHMGFSRSADLLKHYIHGHAPGIQLVTVDEGYAYKDAAVGVTVPFPCNPYYDRKAWKWLTANIEKLADPVVFWNIGA